MNVLLIHQVFGTPKSGGTRHYELARDALQAGHHFTIVAGDTQYQSGNRVVSGVRLSSTEQLDDLTIVRTYTYPSVNKGFVWRVVSFLSFMVSSFLASIRQKEIDVVMGTTPPIFQAVSAWLVAFLRRKPFLLEVRDLWPEFAIDIGILKNPTLIQLSRWLESFLYARADHILVNSPAYREYMIKKGIAPAKVALIANGVIPEMFNPEATGEHLRARWAKPGDFVATYAGAMGVANDLPTLLRAAQILQENHSNCRIWMVGEGMERKRLEEMAHEMGLQNVVFAGLVPKSEMGDVLAASDACIATLKDIPMFRTTYPNKVFDYMAAGRPTVLAIDGVIRDVVEDANGGIFSPPGNAETLANALSILASNPAAARAMGGNARTYVVEHFNRHDQAVAFAQLIETMGKMQ